MVKKSSHKTHVRPTPLQQVWHRVQEENARALTMKEDRAMARISTWSLGGSSEYDLDERMMRLAYGMEMASRAGQVTDDERGYPGPCTSRWSHDAITSNGQVGVQPDSDSPVSPLVHTEQSRSSGAAQTVKAGTIVIDTTTDDDQDERRAVGVQKPASRKGKGNATAKDPLKCSSENCSTDPKCLKWLGQQEWENTGQPSFPPERVESGFAFPDLRYELIEKALETFASSRGVGEDPGLNLREPGVPVGLKVGSPLASDGWNILSRATCNAPQNLGATCYANSFLQVRIRTPAVWFRDPVFRNGIHACKPVSPTSPTPITHSPLYHLQVLFTFLQTSVQAVYDPTPLIRSLKLDTGEQQDATEFQKLFMSLLDHEVRKAGKAKGGSEGEEVGGLIASRFEGKIFYGTRCTGCNNTSERSSTFNELEVTLKANCELEARIAESLGDERMEKENQYYCDNCQKKCDAIRYTRLHSLPPVLHFSLLRFVYSLKQGQRKKSQHSISYPPSIDMSQFVEASQREEEMWYDLKGVLLHKGVSAHHGHYVAQVFDDSSNQWYLFDDEVVTPIEDLDTSRVYKDEEEDGEEGDDEDVDEIVVSSDDEYQEGGSKGRRKPKSKVQGRGKAKVKGKGKVQVQNGGGKTDGTRRPKSKDAYMLVYKRRSESAPRGQYKVIGTSEMAPVPITVDPIPPLLALAEVQRLDDAHGKMVDEYHARVASVKKDFDRLREAKRSVYRVWQVEETREVDEPSYAVDKRELVRWLGQGLKKTSRKQDSKGAGGDERDGGTEEVEEELKKEIANGVDGGNEPHSSITEVQSSSEGGQAMEDVEAGPVEGVADVKVDSSSNKLSSTAIMCEHGKIDPHKADLMKRVSKAGIEALSSLGVTLDPELQIPRDFCRDCVWSHVVEELYVLEHSEHTQAMNGADTGRDVAISKPWFKDWLRTPKPKMHVPGSATDPSPQSEPYLSDVKCEHGLTRHDPKRVEQLSFEESAILQSLFPDWEPMRLEQSQACPQCAKAEAKESKENDRMVALAKKEKGVLKSFTNDTRLGGTQILLTGTGEHLLVPYAFKRQWFEWNHSVSHRSVTSERPGELDNSQLLCEHQRLLADLEAENKKLRTIHPVTSQEWKLLQENYNAGPQIKVWQDYQTLQFLSSPASCEECLQRQRENFATTTIKVVTIGEDKFDKDGNYRKARVDSSDSDEITVLSSPPPATNGKRMPLKAQKTYGQKPVVVRFPAVGATRTSARVRNQGMLYENRSATFIEVNKTDTVKALKISIDHKLSIPTICQRLFFKGEELDDSSATVEKLGMLPDMVLELFEVKEGALGLSKLEDVGDEIRSKGKARREEGFGGTGLSGWEHAGGAEKMVVDEASVVEEVPTGIEASRKRKAEDAVASSSSASPAAEVAVPIASRKKGRQVIIETVEEEEEKAETMLMSEEGVTCPQCTFHNASGMTQCEMCDLPFK
ncbi:BZ3500_MvSof-1268-A1-R1_Chr4-4g07505 [Microbotryum saponariae]|uniref:ubiquitinyl hydrolase 1 n=1 Tax=Microbotryum saponariae TaxID=289078 RepID=A0A2X0NM04_9BASI|nr:BZ3500_MvSof-1268-A1-R1_Chr4-4g07505 [Microbotryum saponariae]SDA07166.1 BZ3501_MvSof-1269-A2-R1_Chr4-3g07213 [Microbotryum saponariae]